MNVFWWVLMTLAFIAYFFTLLTVGTVMKYKYELMMGRKDK